MRILVLSLTIAFATTLGNAVYCLHVRRVAAIATAKAAEVTTNAAMATANAAAQDRAARHVYAKYIVALNYAKGLGRIRDDAANHIFYHIRIDKETGIIYKVR